MQLRLRAIQAAYAYDAVQARTATLLGQREAFVHRVAVDEERAGAEVHLAELAGERLGLRVLELERVENDELRRTFVGLMTAFHGILAGQLAAARDTGTVRQDLDPSDGAVLLISLVQGLAMRWSLGGRGFALRPEGVRLLSVQMALFLELAEEGKQS